VRAEKPYKKAGAEFFVKANRAWASHDSKRALQLFQQAARLGDVSSQNSIGFFYDHGIGTRQNRAKALYWYRRAARSGSISAVANVGISYRQLGNVTLAVRWLKKAIALGDGDAGVELAKIYMRSTRASALQVRKAREALEFSGTSSSITPHGRREAKRLLAFLKA
jgi:hypothetical protein